MHDELLTKLVGLREDTAQDKMINANLKWRYLKVNHTDFARPSETVPNRVLLSVYENVVTAAELG